MPADKNGFWENGTNCDDQFYVSGERWENNAKNQEGNKQPSIAFFFCHKMKYMCQIGKYIFIKKKFCCAKISASTLNCQRW